MSLSDAVLILLVGGAYLFNTKKDNTDTEVTLTDNGHYQESTSPGVLLRMDFLRVRC